MLDSGRGYFCRVDPDPGKAEQVVFCPGLARGLSFWRGYALIGTSLPRDGAFKGSSSTATQSARRGAALRRLYRRYAHRQYPASEGVVRKLFDAAFIPGVRAPMCVGVGNPEMRTLITYPEEGSGSAAEAAA